MCGSSLRPLFLHFALVFLIAPAFAQSSLEQLLDVVDNDPNVSRLAGGQNAIVLTIDGIDKNMIASGAFSTLIKGAMVGRGGSYLAEPVRTKWDFVDDIQYFPWSGDYAKTASEIHNLKQQIESLSKIARNQGKGTDKLTAAERQLHDEKIRIGVQTPPISTGDHSTRGLALLSLQLELP